MSPRGRRPAGSGARVDIVDAARAEFAERGYDAASLRAIARRAGVDPALVHHYFDGKPALFAEVMTVPANPSVVIAAIVASPRAQIGESMARSFFAIWEGPEARERFQGLVRSVVAHEDSARMVREFVVREIFAHIAQAHALPGTTSQDIERRAALAASQLIGVAMMRYVLNAPAAVEATVDELVADLAPTLQRYLAP